MPDENEERLTWERDEGGPFTIVRLHVGYPRPRPCVYIADDDPCAGIGLTTVADMDDLIWRLVQAREWLKDQLNDQGTQ